ncbi:hypothetical protein ACOBQX_10660 [Actinokineospora sp. G85]|uniref:hypothetical protein n=1 Tax=Actinokineospora sp. G85 TaxID=3406626 RepID=UPI003C77F399
MDSADEDGAAEVVGFVEGGTVGSSLGGGSSGVVGGGGGGGLLGFGGCGLLVRVLVFGGGGGCCCVLDRVVALVVSLLEEPLVDDEGDSGVDDGAEDPGADELVGAWLVVDVVTSTCWFTGVGVDWSSAPLANAATAANTVDSTTPDTPRIA